MRPRFARHPHARARACFFCGSVRRGVWQAGAYRLNEIPGGKDKTQQDQLIRGLSGTSFPGFTRAGR